MRGGYPVELLGGGGDHDRHTLLPSGADREAEILRHQVGHKSRGVLPARCGIVDDPGNRMHVLHDPSGARGFGDDSVRICKSTPNASPIRNASLTATATVPEIRLLHNLATSPAPTAPTWIMLLPIAARAGCASARSLASPPTMIAKVPATA